MQKNASQVYQSYLIRCWLAPSAGDELPAWRFELRAVSTEPQKHRFNDLVQVGSFLAVELEAIVERNRCNSDQEGEQGDGHMKL